MFPSVEALANQSSLWGAMTSCSTMIPGWLRLAEKQSEKASSRALTVSIWPSWMRESPPEKEAAWPVRAF